MNMIDGWPQFSDAVVSYDFGKKLAYHYIKRSQQPICLMMSEPESWHVKLMAGNDTLCSKQGTYRVWDGETDETLSEAVLRPSPMPQLSGRVRISHGDQKLMLIEWTVDGIRSVNHYVLGMPPFSFDRYKGWLKKIADLDGSFDASQVEK
ncbi:MAG: hypothetical protein ACOX22_08905 [Caldicoprobacterales bacterium]